jgi:hypothetical protein
LKRRGRNVRPRRGGRQMSENSLLNSLFSGNAEACRVDGTGCHGSAADDGAGRCAFGPVKSSGRSEKDEASAEMGLHCPCVGQEMGAVTAPRLWDRKRQRRFGVRCCAIRSGRPSLP